MMEKLIIGMDLCDNYTQLAVLGREETWSLPTVICRKKSTDEWCVGEEAYKSTLMGEGVIVDKLLSLAMKDGTSTIMGTKYEGAFLLEQFLQRAVDLVRAEYPETPIECLVISLKKLDRKLMDILTGCSTALKLPKERLHLASQTECFVFYVLNQRRDVWGGQVGMFSLSEEDLRYYELKIIRGSKKLTVWAEGEELEEGFNLSVLDTPSGARMADQILCACGERFLSKKVFSSIFLTGKGFTKTDWAPDFIKQICGGRRHVFTESSLFAFGAAYKGEEYGRESSPCPVTCICEGKLRSSVTMEVMKRDVKTQITLAAAGESWYEAKSVLEVIPDGQEDLQFIITSEQDPRQKRLIKIPLEGFPKRPNKTTRIRIAVGFSGENTMVLKIVDRGFGELFPMSGIEIRQEVRL